jgi:enamine deaminase RidA (YjgF/YER057c/UK114 family)
VLFVAGQTAADAGGRVAERGFVAQFVSSLEKTLAVVRAAGGRPEHIGRMTVYVTDLDAYLENRSALKQPWRALMGDHYPAMALVGVTRLVDRDAVVEIEATAVIPNQS